ncbi:NADH-quinone oxidoreductase subunit L [bacterium]|nr:NADH-quinone oxidoreductase subunit L [bacterium]
METTIGLPLAILLAGILLQIILGAFLTPRQKGWLAFLTGLGALIAILSLVPVVASGDIFEGTIAAWDGQFAFQAHVDGLSLIFALMATGIGSAILFYCIDYMAHEAEGTTRFFVLLLTFIAGLVSLVYSANLLLAYLSWELIGLCSYFLVGFWYKNTAAVQGARKVLIMTHIPGYALLLGILTLYSQTGTFLWTDPAIAAHFTTGIFLLMLVAAMAKSVMFPLHTWIPEAMNAPTPVSALLHSACYVKAGIYLVARMYSLHPAPWPGAWQTVVLVIGCITMLVGALFALAQTDLKRLLAFSTISQLGYLVTGLGLGTPAGIAAGLFYTFSHGLFKGTLFLCAGSVQHAAETRDMRQLGGLAKKMPYTTIAWLVAACAIVGVPLTNGFVSKWLLFDAALSGGQWVVVSIAWLVSVITAFYILKATVSVFFGVMPEPLAKQHLHEPVSMIGGMGILATLCVLFGVAPQILSRWLILPAAEGLGLTNIPALTWFGLHTTSSTASAVNGAFVVLLALLIGGLIMTLSRNQQSNSTTVFSGGESLPAENIVDVEDFSLIAETALQPLYSATDPDPLYMSIWKGIRGIAKSTGKALGPIEEQPWVPALVVVLMMMIVVWLS